MSLTEVKFVGIPIVQSPDEDINIDLIYSPRFAPQADDVVLLLPVGWKTLDQHVAVLGTDGKSSLRVKSNVFGEEAGAAGISFHFVYVQQRVPVGMSDPFVVDTPFDEESLHDESLDIDLVVINRTTTYTATTGLYDESSEESMLQDFVGTDVHLKDRKDEHIKNEARVLRVSTAEESESVSSQSLDEQSRGERKLKVDEDEESFIIAGTPSPDSDSRRSGEVQFMMSKLVNEKDELQKLFQKERNITKEQEVRNKDLQQKNNLLLQENNKLRETLSERQLELKKLQEQLSDLSDDMILDTEAPQQGTNVCQMLNDEGSCNEGELLTQSMEYLQNSPGTSALCIRTEIIALPKQSDEETGKTSCTCKHSDHSLIEKFNCPMCEHKFISSTGASSFQRHVHHHFHEEDI